MSGVGSSPALATCETRQVLLAGVSGGFLGVLPFRPTYRLARFYDGNILKRDIKLNKKRKNHYESASLYTLLAYAQLQTCIMTGQMMQKKTKVIMKKYKFT